MENIKKNDIIERIKTFDDACKELGNNHPLVKEWVINNTYLRKIASLYPHRAIENLSPDITAYAQLRIIAAALNDGWKPTFEEGEKRWFPFFLHTDSGLVYTSAYNASSYSFADFGSRLAFKNEKLAEYAGTQFIDIYKKYLIS